MLIIDECDGSMNIRLDYWDNRITDKVAGQVVEACNAIVTQTVSHPQQTVSYL